MSAKSVLLIGNTQAKSSEALRDAASKSGVLLDAVSPEMVIMNEDGSFSKPWLLTKRDIWSYDTYFFRGLGSNIPKLQNFLKELKIRGKRVVEKELLRSGALPEDKFVLPSKLGFYELPKTQYVESKNISTFKTDLTFPVVFKKTGIGSSKGKGVFLVQTEKDLEGHLESFFGIAQVQEYHPIEFDTRVFVVGGVCMGGYNRYKGIHSSFLTNAKGGKRVSVLLSPQQVAAAIEATAQQGLEIAGVDMFFSRGKDYIIEVNASPQFAVFEDVTGYKVSQNIIDYLVQ